MLSLNQWQINQRNAEQADKEATNITNNLLFPEPMSLCTSANVDKEVYFRQRIWMARYMQERARITAELTNRPMVDFVKQEIKPQSSQFARGAYSHSKGDY